MIEHRPSKPIFTGSPLAGPPAVTIGIRGIRTSDFPPHLRASAKSGASAQILTGDCRTSADPLGCGRIGADAPLAQWRERRISNPDVVGSSPTGGSTLAVTLRLSSGKVALIDLEDLERVSAFKWSACWIASGWYAKSWAGGKQIYLHRFIVGARRGQIVDHISGDSLDCRKANMRIVGTRENSLNRRANRGNGTGFKGVMKRGAGFQARIGLDGNRRVIGSFRTAEEAARAYDAAARELHGEYARCNFPDTEGRK